MWHWQFCHFFPDFFEFVPVKGTVRAACAVAQPVLFGVRVLHSHVIHGWVYRVEVNLFGTNLSITDDGHVISRQVHLSLEVCCQNCSLEI